MTATAMTTVEINRLRLAKQHHACTCMMLVFSFCTFRNRAWNFKFTALLCRASDQETNIFFHFFEHRYSPQESISKKICDIIRKKKQQFSHGTCLEHKQQRSTTKMSFQYHLKYTLASFIFYLSVVTFQSEKVCHNIFSAHFSTKLCKFEHITMWFSITIQLIKSEGTRLLKRYFTLKAICLHAVFVDENGFVPVPFISLACVSSETLACKQAL